MDGSFTDEAQAEFNKLVRKDPVFAEKVSRAMAERIGEAPEGELAQVEGRLDSKMEDVWNRYRPSPFLSAFKRAAALAFLLFVSWGLYFLARQSAPFFHWASSEVSALSQWVSDSDQAAAPSGTVHALKKVHPAKTMTKSIQVAASGGVEKNSPYSAVSRTSAAAGGPSKGRPLLVPSASSQAGIGPASSAPSAPSLSANTGESASGTQPVASMNNPQTSIPEQGPSGLPALEPSLPSVQGGNMQSREGNTLSVSIETQKTQNVVVTVLDSNGNQVRQLYQGQWNAGTHMVDWDGKDDSANPVLPGNYTVVVNADGKTMSGVVTVQPNMGK